MKKIALVAVAVLLLVILCVVLISGSNEPSQKIEVTTQPTQLNQSTAPSTDAQPVAVFENGNFTFTASQFLNRFANSLPEGYKFADAIENNEARNNNLQVDILTGTGEKTGFAVLFNVKENGQIFNQMALTAGQNDAAEDFSALVNWFTVTFLSGISREAQAEYCEAYTELFESKSDDYKLFNNEDYVTMMLLEKEDIGNQYYILISINKL